MYHDPEIKLLENGNLEITADDNCRAELEELRADYSQDQVLHELLESHWANGSFQYFDAGKGNPFVGLSDAPCITKCESLTQDDDGKLTIHGNFWAYLDYMVTCPIEELIEKGEVIFSLVK